ncbi:MAG TPA: DUF2617 family protein [Thermoguttaceae bacterium]
MLTVRPKIAELVLQLYGRPLHPELFEILCSRTVQCGDYQAKIDITSTGHVVTWRYAGLTLTEVATSAQNPMPKNRRLMSHRLRGQRSDGMACRGGACYKMNFQLEAVEPEIFWIYQQELALDGLCQGMLQQFDAGGRIALGALSYINIQTRCRQLTVQAFHTFPDDYVVVKTLSLFQLP